MKSKQLKGFLALALLFFLGSAAIVARTGQAPDRRIDPAQMKAEDYPLGDIPLDKAAFQKFYRQYPESVLKALPTSYDARSEGIVSLPKNQGSCGSCWAFATTGAMESHIKRTYPAALLYDLSEQQQVSCNTGMSGCSGGSSTAILFWESRGPNTEADYPYASGGGSVPACNSGYAEVGYRVANFYTTSGTENYKASLFEKGPSYWRYDVHQDFQDYWNGSETKAYLNTAASFKGGHAVLIIGWDDNKDVMGGGKGAFLCKNSWGATGGPNHDGTFWIAYSGHANSLGFGMCNFDVYDNISPATLAVTSPNGGESWMGNDTHTITWTSTGSVGNVRIDYSTDGGTNWLPVTGDTANDGSYAWSVPNTPSAACLVRVSKAASGDPTDSSDSAFTILPNIAPFIAVSSPAGGALWERGRTYAITWLKHGTQNASVKILLYKGTSTLVKTIIGTTPNDGLFGWLVPADLALGSTYFIRVKTVDNLITADSDKFSVIVPAITVTAPATGTVWMKNAAHAIAWNRLGTQDANVKILLYAGTTKKLDITLSTPNSGSCDWFIPPALANGTYTVKVITLDGKVTGVSKAFTILTGLIRVTLPAAGSKWFRGMPWDIAWTSEGTVNANVKIQLYKGTTKVLDISPGTPTAAGIFNWTIPAAQAVATNYSIKVTGLDNLVSGKTGSFAIVPGVITVTAPAKGAGWQRGLPHLITWTKQGVLINANVKVQLYQGTTLVKTMAATTPNDGSYEWTIPAAQALATNYKVRVTTVDNLVQASSGAFAVSKTTGLVLTAPNGNELLKPAEAQAIRWTNDPDVLEVQLEFSRDNGSTYATIADHVPSTGSYDWLVPVNFTRNGIVRVVDASGRPWQEEGLLEYTFEFLPTCEGEEPGMNFWFGASDPNAPSFGFGRIEVSNGAVAFSGVSKATEPLAGNWHEMKVRLDLRRDTAGIWLDGNRLFENAPLHTTREHYFEPGLALNAGGGQAMEMLLDDLAISIVRQDAAGEDRESFRVLTDDFERYEGKAGPLAGGWQRLGMAGTDGQMEVDTANPENKVLRLQTEAGKRMLLRLPFSLPVRVPFDISDERFTITQ